MSSTPTSAPVPLIVDSTCIEAIDPISDQPTFDRFHFITSQQNFSDGSDLCISLLPGLGAYPASLRNDQENSLVTDLYFASFPLLVNEIEDKIIRSPSLNYFMGLIDPVFNVTPTKNVDRFHWIDGTPLEFGNVSGAFPWAVNEPNNFDIRFEGCGEYRRDKVGWNDAECSLERMMLCRSQCPSPTVPPTKSPTSQPTTTTASPTFQPTASPNNMTYYPTITPSKPDGAILDAGGISTPALAFVIILSLLAIGIVLIAIYGVKKFIQKRNEEKRFTLDIESLPFDAEDNVIRLMGKVKLRNNKNSGPPLPPRERAPPGMAPLRTRLEFHDNRVSDMQVPRDQYPVHAKRLVGLGTARNLLGLPIFFRESFATIGTGATDPSLRRPLHEARETVNTFVTRQRSAISGLTSPTVPTTASLPKISSDEEHEKIIIRSPSPPTMDLRDSAKTTVLTDDHETGQDL